MTGSVSLKGPWGSLAAFLLLCLAVGIGGGWATQQSVETWYPALVKPFWTPPPWVFPLAWTVLYIMIAIAGWLLYQAEPSLKRTEALTAYGIQLFLNFSWSFLFFWMRSPMLGLIDIILLWIMIMVTVVKAGKVRPLAALLLVPYLLWVSYALTLNLGIWMMNRTF